MATAMIILEDDGPDGEVNFRLRFEAAKRVSSGVGA